MVTSSFTTMIVVDGFLIVRMLNRITRLLSRKHGAFRKFCSMFRDAVFVVNQAEKDNLYASLRKQGLADAEIKIMEQDNYSYFSSRCTRQIPSPEDLLPRLEVLFAALADVPDAETKLPLFGTKARTKWKALLKHVSRGCLSDRPGMYSNMVM